MNKSDMFDTPTKESRKVMGGIIKKLPETAYVVETSFGYFIEMRDKVLGFETFYLHYDKETNIVVSSVLCQREIWEV